MQDAAGNVDVGAAVFTGASRRHGTAKRLGHSLEAVADAKDRDAQLKQLGFQRRSAILIDRRRTAGKNQSDRILGLDFFHGGRVRNNLGVDVGLTDATCDELRVLSAKVHNEDWTRSSGWVSHALQSSPLNRL